MKPFLYIASIRRTGSTMIAELLSDLPRSFVFREPRLVKGRLRLKPETAALFADHGVDVLELSVRMKSMEPSDAIRTFCAFRRRISDQIPQLGIKEIRHEGHEAVSEAFPDMKVIVTARDPRDIFLSLLRKQEDLARRKRRWDDPAVLAADVNAAFAAQRALMNRHPHHCVKYEDLCRNPEALEAIRIFAESDVRGTGLLGRTSRYNYEQHGEQIRDTRVGLWRRERDGEIRKGLNRAYDLMREYAAFWGYPPA